ncbi:hypothetical protein F5890DRAFT_1477390 [Lentinula detonsa]|uniref:CxC2-like cysteine cluster KDZ transposase-associated domain-containing protein n=1 Tax=Lentinula detonsa TaxID=2804962 RepID=A0AA38PS59_9AGAR|nr:hypothetical protein F5890DRAFT_1477390 [Lentinula detonsa]
MDLGEDAGDSSGSDADEEPSSQPRSENWQDEEPTEDEVLLYFQAKGSVQDFELKDYRTRHQKTVIDQERWDSQMTDLLEAYMEFGFRRSRGESYSGEVKEKHIITVWSVFDHKVYEVPVFVSDTIHNTSYIRSGLLPCNPLVNTTVFSLETLELYHHIFMRCPRLGVQTFIRALSDLQGVRFKANLAVQFSSAYDLYVRLVEGARALVLQALDRTSSNHRMLNTCPSCQYEVKGESPLAIRMMVAFDGNNSLKRFQRREASEDGRVLGAVTERLDTRVGGGDYFLQTAQVDLWDEPNWGKWLDWAPSGKETKNPCADRWSNMNESKTARSFACFEVNGIFAGFCRHSFVLVFADMVRTGEQSKYILALLHHFMSACREDRRRRGLPETPVGSLGVGYDIACGMVDKIARSPLAIASYSYHRDNFETYANLSKFIYSNYRQALSILNRSRDTAATMKEVGIEDAESIFQFLEEERLYLESRRHTPEHETLTSSYYLALVKLSNCQERLGRARWTFRGGLGGSTGGSAKPSDGDLFLTEREMSNEQEMEAKLLLDVQSLEERLGLRRDQRWVKGSKDWKNAETLVYMSKYQKALDRLEGLIIARIFELSRMNVSGTGYKMRQHIGHAMQKRSTAIISALESYNEAAAKLKPPHKLLSWEDVLNYTYLSEFDFLRDTRSDVRDCIWARPAVREAMSEVFKLLRAGEEVDRLHLEIKRLLTYIKEEEEYISSVARRVEQYDAPLAHQILQYGHERGRFNGVHRKRLQAIRKLKGFKPVDSHFFHPGIGVRRQGFDLVDSQKTQGGSEGGNETDSEDDNEDEEEEAQANDVVEIVLAVANDNL